MTKPIQRGKQKREKQLISAPPLGVYAEGQRHPREIILNTLVWRNNQRIASATPAFLSESNHAPIMENMDD